MAVSVLGPKELKELNLRLSTPSSFPFFLGRLYTLMVVGSLPLHHQRGVQSLLPESDVEEREFLGSEHVCATGSDTDLVGCVLKESEE